MTRRFESKPELLILLAAAPLVLPIVFNRPFQLPFQFGENSYQAIGSYFVKDFLNHLE